MSPFTKINILLFLVNKLSEMFEGKTHLAAIVFFSVDDDVMLRISISFE